MPDLIVKYPDRAPDTFHLGRLRITIGRSARNDLCIPDPFASRVHAEVRREGDIYVLQDLGSANGTLYNGERVENMVALAPGGRIQIGETEIEFFDQTSGSPAVATMIADMPSPPPDATIALDSGHRTTSGLLEDIEGARTQKSGEIRQATSVLTQQQRAKTISTPSLSSMSSMPSAAAQTAEHSDLLALISKVSVTLLAHATLDETLNQVTALVFEAVSADRCLIMLRDEKQQELQVRVAQVRDKRGNLGEIRVSRSIIEEVVNQGRAVLTSDAQHDPRFASATMTIQGIRSVLAVPLGVGEKIFGMIYADSPLSEARFSQDHLTVLTTLASVAAIRVENARLVEEQIDRERLERELNLAREIQQRFQPTSPPLVPGFELQGISFPCYEIGGDYYDFIRREDGRLVIALGDVSGKGTSAALLMSSLHAAIHTPPLIAHAAGTMEQLGAGGMPLGIMPTAPYREGRTQLNPGDALVIYSDGVTETQNQAGEEFGPIRLYDVVM